MEVQELLEIAKKYYSLKELDEFWDEAKKTE